MTTVWAVMDVGGVMAEGTEREMRAVYRDMRRAGKGWTGSLMLVEIHDESSPSPR